MTRYTTDNHRIYEHAGATDRPPMSTRSIALAATEEDATEIAAAMNAPRHLFQVWNAGNDRNGNPRRATIVYCARTGALVAAIDDGYRGDQIPRGAATLPTVNCSVADYREALKMESARAVARRYLAARFPTEINAIGREVLDHTPEARKEFRANLRACAATEDQIRSYDDVRRAIWEVEVLQEKGSEYLGPGVVS